MKKTNRPDIERYVMDKINSCAIKKANRSCRVDLSRFIDAMSCIRALPYDLEKHGISASLYGLKTNKPYVEIEGYEEETVGALYL